MIHLITLNPAVDNYVEIENIEKGKTNYSKKQYIKFGGKACNVAQVLNTLSVDYNLVTTRSDEFEYFINEDLKNINKTLIKTDAIRINTKIKINNEITEINSSGTQLPEDSKKEFLSYINKEVKKEDYVLIAGNPNAKDYEFMINLCKEIKSKNAKLLLDTSKIKLSDIKNLKPYYIKPNIDELEDLLEKKIKLEDLTEETNELVKFVDNVMISLGEKGIYLRTENEYVNSKIIKGKAINTVGAGDSSVAGFLYSKTKGFDIKDTANFSAACGSATAFSKDLATLDLINETYKK